MASTPASASSRACASRRRQSTSCSAAWCSRTCAASGRRCPTRSVRLILVLKAASLALGHSGVRQATIDAAAGRWSSDALPVIPAKGSVGASGDLAPLAHLAGCLIGVGEVRLRGQSSAAAEALARDRRARRSTLAAKEGLALLNGTQVSTALAIAGLFEARRVFDAALVAGAMSTDAALGSDVPFDPRLSRVRGQPGQAEVAGRLHGLLAGSEIRASHLRVRRGCRTPTACAASRRSWAPCLDLLDDGRRRRWSARPTASPTIPWCSPTRAADPLRRQLPRRAGGVRRRPDRGGPGRDRLARPSGGSRC